MKRYLLKSILLLATCFVVQNVFAENFSKANSEGVTIYYNSLDATTCEVSRGTYSGKVTIPSTVTYNGTTYTVTGIGRNAFREQSVSSVSIPNSVTSIGYASFYKCSSLTSVNIPNSVTSIDSYAFFGCTVLNSIDVESGNSVYDSRNNCNAIIETASNTLIQGCKTIDKKIDEEI